jgi:peptide/nickel transport system permease protein
MSAAELSPRQPASATPPGAPVPSGPSIAPWRIAWRRRGTAFTAFCREYAKSKAGLVGLGVLLLIVALALAAPLWITKDDLSAINAPGIPLQAPSGRFWLGTDAYGRSMVAVTIWGARISLLVGFISSLISMVIGTLFGIVAGHFGGWTSNVLMRIVDWFLVLPTLVLATALASVLNPGVTTVVAAIGVTSWAGTARMVRAQTLTVEARPFIERSKALGGGHWHVMSRHVLPNVMPLVIANTTLTVSGAVIGESTMAYLGMEDPTKLSWGTSLDLAVNVGAVSSGDWWYILPPGVAVLLVALSFTLVGRTIEAVLNPRMRLRGR